MKKILTVIGARPQFIKASVVSNAVSQSNQFQEIIVHTGQHFDSNMSEIFFEELGMSKPNYYLDIHGCGHGAMTGRMLEQVERVLITEKPDIVLVYGDTNSTLAGALAAAKLHIPVAHVEAGLRSFNTRMPEELNRILTDHMSTWLFTPTEAAIQHLRAEGIPLERIIPVGDVMYDVALRFAKHADSKGASLSSLDLSPGTYVLVTVHRAENTDDLARLSVIVTALIEAARNNPVIWPIHPRTRVALQRSRLLDKLQASSVRLIEPVGYLDMLKMEKNAALVVTDSGGVQKEAYFFKIPCVTIRNETEWVELVNAGWNRLVQPLDSDTVVQSIREAIGTHGSEIPLYGDGNAAIKIVDRLSSDL